MNTILNTPESGSAIVLALLISAFLLLGAVFTVLAALGLVRVQSFYARAHMTSFITSGGVISIIIASLLYRLLWQRHFGVYELLIPPFLIITSCVTTMMLTRAAIHRDQSQTWQKTLGNHPDENTAHKQ
ncbi:monovalent cation/H(+) antiporter subunit G [Bartonella sp. DGB2]|uniref:monovalent cation/H(+) antiporter subunit G n=1 Tax=Bartonella sp. DGB2 TaxID=3388426 RepID=UPI00398FA34D